MSKEEIKNEIIPWLKKWWLVVLVCVPLICYIYVYFSLGSEHKTLTFLQFLINFFVSIAIILYVIYTRDLAISSQSSAEASRKTAEANLKLVESMQSMLLEQWVCELRDTPTLIPTGKDVSSKVHIEDKHVQKEKYEEYLNKPKRRILIFKPRNCGSRLVLLYSVKFQISDTRSSKARDISYDPPKPVLISKDEEQEIPVAYNVEGEMEIRVSEISYQDGDIKQNRWIANGYKEIDRYQEPEGLVTKE